MKYLCNLLAMFPMLPYSLDMEQIANQIFTGEDTMKVDTVVVELAPFEYVVNIVMTDAERVAGIREFIAATKIHDPNNVAAIAMAERQLAAVINGEDA